MTNQKQIKVRIFPDGQVQAVVTGIPGKKCTDYISVLEALLDAEVIDSETTSEYYQSENILSETNSLVISSHSVNQTTKS